LVVAAHDALTPEGGKLVEGRRPSDRLRKNLKGEDVGRRERLIAPEIHFVLVEVEGAAEPLAVVDPLHLMVAAVGGVEDLVARVPVPAETEAGAYPAFGAAHVARLELGVLPLVHDVAVIEVEDPARGGSVEDLDRGGHENRDLGAEALRLEGRRVLDVRRVGADAPELVDVVPVVDVRADDRLVATEIELWVE